MTETRHAHIRPSTHRDRPYAVDVYEGRKWRGMRTFKTLQEAENHAWRIENATGVVA